MEGGSKQGGRSKRTGKSVETGEGGDKTRRAERGGGVPGVRGKGREL